MHLGSATAIENSVMKSMYPELINVPTNFVDEMDINIEGILKLDPDVVIYLADYKNQYDVMTEAGIPAVGVTTQTKGNALKTMESWLKIMGKAFGTDTENINTTKVLDYGAQVQEEIAEIVNKIPQEDKPKVLYLYGHSEDEIMVSGKDFYGGFWIESSGGINVANEITGQSVVNMEQIYKWNPDVILITTMTETIAEDILNNSIEGQDWSQIEAVKNGKVFKEPLGVFHWFPPSGDAPLMANWMAQTLHLDLFIYSMSDEIKLYYENFCGYKLTQEQIEGILTSNTEAGKGAFFGDSK